MDCGRNIATPTTYCGAASVVPGGHGTVRTMPRPGSMADILFVTISCSDWKRDGAWLQLEQFVRDQQPRFILMIGDQVYLGLRYLR